MNEPKARDELLERLTEARAHNGRGTATQRRELVHFCARAFREWHGIQFVSEVSILPIRRLSRREMVEWLRLAEDLPAVARDVLKLHRSVTEAGQRLSLRDMRWSAGRRRQLIELHRFALLGASRQAQRAQESLDKAVREKGQHTEGAISQRRRMVTAAENVIDRLSQQLQALQKTDKESSGETPKGNKPPGS